MAGTGEATFSLDLGFRLPLTVLWALIFPIQLYVTYLYIHISLSSGSSRRVIFVEIHERLRDRQYLLSLLVIFSPPMAFLTIFTWSSPIKATWALIDDGPFEGFAFAALTLIAVVWCCAMLFGMVSMFSDGAYIGQLSPAFFCQRCGCGWRRFIGSNPIRRKLNAEGPPHYLVELCNETIYKTFGGEKVDGLLHASVANAVLAKLTEGGQQRKWLYGLCNTHFETEVIHGDEESASTLSTKRVYNLSKILVLKYSKDSYNSQKDNGNTRYDPTCAQTHAFVSRREHCFKTVGIVSDVEASARDLYTLSRFGVNLEDGSKIAIEDNDDSTDLVDEDEGHST